MASFQSLGTQQDGTLAVGTPMLLARPANDPTAHVLFLGASDEIRVGITVDAGTAPAISATSGLPYFKGSSFITIRHTNHVWATAVNGATPITWYWGALLEGNQ